MSSFRAGAVMITFLAPACRCARALLASVKKPVDSMMMSAPTSPQGMAAAVDLVNADRVAGHRGRQEGRVEHAEEVVSRQPVPRLVHSAAAEQQLSFVAVGNWVLY